MSATGVQPIYGLVEAFFNGVGPEKHVINAFSLVWDGSHDLIIATCVSIT